MDYQEVGVGGTFSTQLICQGCGCVVWDKEQHDRWHARMDLFETVRRTIEHKA